MSDSLFRLPSGAIVERRDLSADIAKNLSVAEIGYVLGARLRDLPGTVDIAEAQVVWWQAVDEELAEAVQRAIGSRHPIVPLTKGELRFRFGDFSPIAPGRRVVFLTDSLLTGRTVSRVARIIRRMEGVPIAIAAILDGRIDYNAPVPIFGYLIPVVSCISQKLVYTEVEARSKALEDIDPIDRDPGNKRLRVDYPIRAKTFLSWLRADAESDLFIGHIDRGPARHFTTYLNVGSLVAAHPEAIDAIEGSIIQALGPARLDAGVIRVIYPASDDGYAHQLALAIAERLRGTSRALVEEVPASRRIGSDWRLSGGPWSERFIAVIVDWGAVTTSTLRDLMSLAARSGAQRIHAAAVTSQVDEEAEWQLRSVAAIAEYWNRPADSAGGLFPMNSPTSVRVEVPVSTAFMCRVHLGMATGSECHLCQIAQQLMRNAARAPTRLLRQHASRKYEFYRPKPRREVLRLPAADIVGGPLTPEAAADVWNVHQLLEDARSSTASRAEVRRRVFDWHAGRDWGSAEAWIRLLTVETYWLDQQPLDADDIRTQIALACVEILAGQTATIGRRELRWQAATVLRAASKRIFVERFGELLESSAEDEIVSSDLCLGMYSLLRRPYNHTPSVMLQVLSALLDARDRLIASRASDIVSKDLLFTIDVLHRQALEVQTRVEQPGDTFSAWHALQSSYVMPMNTHVGALSSMLVVLNAFSGPAASRAAESADRKPDQRYWGEIADAWAVCWDFLADSVFPSLSILRDLIEASTGRSAWLSAPNIWEFNSERAARFAAELADLEQVPSRFTPGLRRALEAEAFAWFEGLLRAKEAPENPRRTGNFEGCLLLRLVSENPCELAHAWDLARARAVGGGLRLAEVIGKIPRGEMVFCRRPLLVDTFTHILQNAAGERHKAEGRPLEGVTLEIAIKISDDIITVQVRNNWSHPEETRIGGLSVFANELSDFGASLTHERLDVSASGQLRSPTEWTHGVKVTLRRWKAGGGDGAPDQSAVR